VPAERWDIEAAYSPDVATDKMYVRHAGFLRSVDAFDADAFRWVRIDIQAAQSQTMLQMTGTRQFDTGVLQMSKEQQQQTLAALAAASIALEPLHSAFRGE
jgi:hypothetical protein